MYSALKLSYIYVTSISGIDERRREIYVVNEITDLSMPILGMPKLLKVLHIVPFLQFILVVRC